MIHLESQFKKIKRGKELHQSSSRLSNSALQERMTDSLLPMIRSFIISTGNGSIQLKNALATRQERNHIANATNFSLRL